MITLLNGLDVVGLIVLIIFFSSLSLIVCEKENTSTCRSSQAVSAVRKGVEQRKVSHRSGSASVE